MIEITGDIFEQEADAICVTTNGVVKANGELVMGAGLALEFKRRYPGLSSNLGILVDNHGNHSFLCYQINDPSTGIISLPTKNNWKANSDLALITRSCRELVDIADKKYFERIVLPRPGCGMGGLKWKDVKPHIEDILDDRFYVISND